MPEAYSWDPLTMFEGLTEASILGVEAAIWSETLVTLRDFEYMAFPRLPGAAEIAWSRGDARTVGRVQAAARGAGVAMVHDGHQLLPGP